VGHRCATALHQTVLRAGLAVGAGRDPRVAAEVLCAGGGLTYRTHVPPTGSSWIAVVRWRPVRRACRAGTVPLALELIEGHGAGGEPGARPGGARMPPGSGTGFRGWSGCRAGACGPRAIRGREADASPESSGRPGFRPAAGRP
jgi:hypothetical protein